MNSIIFKPWNAILILLIFSLGLYYNTLNAELLSLDDKRLIDSYNNGNTDIKNYFFPQGTHSYYRPVVHLSFLVDYLIWMDHESGFHLTNIILHSANVILVYILCLLMLNKMKGSRGQGVKGSSEKLQSLEPLNPRTLEPSFIAFFAALLFAIHPINTEAVNFIASRTDILATFFVLISFILWVIGQRLWAMGYGLWAKPIAYCLSPISYFLAILSKEVALTFPLIIIAYEYFSSRRLKSAPRLKHSGTSLRLLILFTLPAVIYFYLRSLGVSEVDIGIRKTMGITDKISSGLFVDFAAAVGFYLKKLIYPFPLNFAIVEINKGLYFIIGAIFLVFLIFQLLNSSTPQLLNFLMWSIFLSLLPSLAISLTDISWTPYAERYLYLPSVFFCILMSYGLWVIGHRLWAMGYGLWAKPITYCLLPIAYCLWFSVATYNRNTLWLSNLAMWEDTIKKSPKFGKAYNEYGAALVMKGENESAKRQFLKAAELGDKTTPLFNLGYLAMRNNDFELAEKYFTEGVKIIPDAAVYRKLGSVYLEMNGRYRDKDYLSKAIEYLEKAYRMDGGDEILALKLAGLYCRVNRYEDAKAILQNAINGKPGSYIEKPARKILDKINELEAKGGIKESVAQMAGQ